MSSNTQVPGWTERAFGLSVGTVCAALAGLFWWRGQERVSVALAGAGAVLILTGLAAPAVLRVPNRVWWRLALALGWVNSRVLLTVFFFIVLTPAGLVMRLAGQDPLRPPKGQSTWTAYGSHRRSRKHYEHLF